MVILSIWLILSSYLSTVTSSTCGIDNSPVPHVYGTGYIETYPWLGVLIYPHDKQLFTTAVVLVTRQMVIATALEIDKLPNDFRNRARVILGHNCTTLPGIPIRAYNYHPDYSKNTFSAIALIQLEVDDVIFTLRPICPPPKILEFPEERFFAMVLSENCNRSKMKIHKMTMVSMEECQNFYRRTELDIESLWPTHTACARSVEGGECVWRSGAILVAKLGKRWSLLGFGLYGPGCQAPARFLDYGMYHEWVERSIQRIGRPAITRIAPNHVVLRRSLSNVQRFGPCDKYEMIRELYSETIEIQRKAEDGGKVAPAVHRYNLTIYADVEYSCVILRADGNAEITSGTHNTPLLTLQRFCTGLGHTRYCFTGVQFIKIEFFVEIKFPAGLVYSVKAYGRRVRAFDPTKAHKYANVHSNPCPILLTFKDQKSKYRDRIQDGKYPLYGKKRMKSRIITKKPV